MAPSADPERPEPEGRSRARRGRSELAAVTLPISLRLNGSRKPLGRAGRRRTARARPARFASRLARTTCWTWTHVGWGYRVPRPGAARRPQPVHHATGRAPRSGASSRPGASGRSAAVRAGPSRSGGPAQGHRFTPLMPAVDKLIPRPFRRRSYWIPVRKLRGTSATDPSADIRAYFRAANR